jgi:signal transduction histidine kinase
MPTAALRWTRSLWGAEAVAGPARLTWLLAVGPALFALLALMFGFVRGLDLQGAFAEFLVSTVVAAVATGAVGAVILSRQPMNRVGWLFCAFGMGAGLTAAAGQYARYALAVDGNALAAVAVVAWVNRWLWLVGMVLPAAILLVLFPTGQALSQRWRVFAWLESVGIMLVAIASAFTPTALPNLPEVANPFGLESASLVLDAILALSPLILVGGIAGGVASLVVRYRRARGDERQALKWFAYATALMVAAVSVRPLLELFGIALSDTAILVTRILEAAAMACLPVGAAIAILRYRLWDIDLLINRTLAYGALTATVVGIYVLVLGYFGMVFQTRGDVASLLAAGIVAVLFQPLRLRLQRGVNHLLYGQRDEPYTVLARLGQRLEASLAPHAVLPAIVQTVREALKLPYLAIALQHDGKSAIAATTGVPSSNLMRLPLLYQQEVVGELLLAPRARGETFSPADRQLLEDLGRQVGIVAHAVRLTADLQRARTRLVTAREEERRRLRRDLHDGLGPALSSVMLKLAAARHHLEADSAADALVAEARTDLRATLADVRRLVYELRPPALDQLGLVHAIHEQVERCRAAELRVHLETPDRLPALPAAVEVAAFLIMQLAVEEAEPPHVTAGDNTWSSDHLRIEICDDGRGLPVDGRHGVGLVSMRERADELGGTLWLGSGPAGGTRVVARLPFPPREVQV